MAILWRKEMSVGNDLIDQDHRYLICLFNSIELILSEEGLHNELPFYFAQLLEYTRFHFGREEKIQLKSNYAGYLMHKERHQRIIERLNEVNQELQNGKKEIRDDLLALIREWIVDHLVKTDIEMGPHLRKFPPNYQ